MNLAKMSQFVQRTNKQNRQTNKCDKIQWNPFNTVRSIRIYDPYFSFESAHGSLTPLHSFSQPSEQLHFLLGGINSLFCSVNCFLVPFFSLCSGFLLLSWLFLTICTLIYIFNLKLQWDYVIQRLNLQFECNLVKYLSKNKIEKMNKKAKISWKKMEKSST